MDNYINSIDMRIAQYKAKGRYTGEKGGIIQIQEVGGIPRITSKFGMRYHPILHDYKMHTGVDIKVPSGTPVYAMADGEVIISEYFSSYGKLVVIYHGRGITSLYAHNSELLVNEGEEIKKGQMISKSGSTGYSTGPHLHFEVRLNGEPINPMPYFILGE